MQQRVQPQQRPQQSNPDIVQRAVKNNARFADDTTQKELEAMHGHSEAQQRMAQEHSRNCQTLHTKAADGAKIIEAETQSMFGSVEPSLWSARSSVRLWKCIAFFSMQLPALYCPVDT
jgi:uncharacterized protein (DUF2336 family)